MSNKILSRRSFIKAAVASVAGFALTNMRWAFAQSSSDPLVEELAKSAFVAPLPQDKIDAWIKSLSLEPRRTELQTAFPKLEI